jgi:NAD-dependent SIR2 family protein deacetylase
LDSSLPHAIRETITRARAALAEAEALVIGAGAGMGVDSGLPDFRGDAGFWEAYPPYRALGFGFQHLANPRSFKVDPALGWGFYGHRQALYAATTPHPGFGMVRDFAARLRHGAFVFTSNVDGQFTRAGFAPDRVVECHGSIHHQQCLTQCTDAIWPATPAPSIEMTTMRATEPLPRCARCGGLARPNILMFGDAGWLGARTDAQHDRYARWLSELGRSRLVILEFGAGEAIATVRSTCEALAAGRGATLIRVNPREPQGPRGTLSLPMGALAACEALLGAPDA